MTVFARVGLLSAGINLMKFTVTYDGELRANGKSREKETIRQQIAPQLEELWKITPALRALAYSRHVPTRGYYPVFELHHSVDAERPLDDTAPDETWVDLCKPVKRGNRTFHPLVRNSLALTCAIKVTFLRKEGPGAVYQGGDLDNRIKTLFDALSVPTQDQLIKDDLPDPTYCLLEDDSLISGLSVETHRLLSSPNGSQHDVKLLMEIEVRVTNPRTYNIGFLGD